MKAKAALIGSISVLMLLGAIHLAQHGKSWKEVVGLTFLFVLFSA